MIRLIDDKRPIVRVEGTWNDTDPQISWQTLYVYAVNAKGKDCIAGNCDRIEVYEENGQMAKVPWFAIWKNEQVIARVDAQGLQVTYDISDPGEIE